jgi:hypothetical protein
VKRSELIQDKPVSLSDSRIALDLSFLMTASFSPTRLLRIPEPFDHPDWLDEVSSTASARWRTSPAITASSSRITVISLFVTATDEAIRAGEVPTLKGAAVTRQDLEPAITESTMRIHLVLLRIALAIVVLGFTASTLRAQEASTPVGFDALTQFADTVYGGHANLILAGRQLARGEYD